MAKGRWKPRWLLAVVLLILFLDLVPAAPDMDFDGEDDKPSLLGGPSSGNGKRKKKKGHGGLEDPDRDMIPGSSPILPSGAFSLGPGPSSGNKHGNLPHNAPSNPAGSMMSLFGGPPSPPLGNADRKAGNAPQPLAPNGNNLGSANAVLNNALAALKPNVPPKVTSPPPPAPLLMPAPAPAPAPVPNAKGAPAPAPNGAAKAVAPPAKNAVPPPPPPPPAAITAPPSPNGAGKAPAPAAIVPTAGVKAPGPGVDTAPAPGVGTTVLAPFAATNTYGPTAPIVAGTTPPPNGVGTVSTTAAGQPAPGTPVVGPGPAANGNAGLPPGIVVGPNGQLTLPNGAPAPGGIKMAPNGQLVLPDGTQVPNGIKQGPNGDWQLPNGQVVMYSNGTLHSTVNEALRTTNAAAGTIAASPTPAAAPAPARATPARAARPRSSSPGSSSPGSSSPGSSSPASSSPGSSAPADSGTGATAPANPGTANAKDPGDYPKLPGNPGLSYQAATRCSGGPSRGAQQLQTMLQQYFPSKSDGIYNCRNVRGGSSLSLHSEGRAIDWHYEVNKPEQKAEAERLINYLTRNGASNAANMGVEEIIYNRKYWSSKAPSFRDYHGENPHTDHVHIGLNQWGAQNFDASKVPAPGSTPAAAPGAAPGAAPATAPAAP